jgi:hypothetical protein
MAEFVMKFKNKLNIPLAIWWVAAWIAWFGFYFYLVPGGPSLGVSGSPDRLALSLMITAICWSPTMLMTAVWDYFDQERRAEFNGVKYERGKTYSYLTTRRVVLWGIGTALFIATGSVPAAVFDLGALTITMIAVVFGPIDTMVICFATWVIRGPLAYGMGPLMVVGAGFSDSKYGYVQSYIWHRYCRPRYAKGAMGKVMATIIVMAAWLTMYIFQRIGTVWGSGRFMMPDPAWLVANLTAFITFYPHAGFNALLGCILAFSLGRYLWAKKPPEYDKIYLDDLIMSLFIPVQGLIYGFATIDAAYNPKM